MIKKLYAPWRASYFETEEKEDSSSKSCPFCIQAQPQEDAHFILKRLNNCYIMLNLYPYNPGHLMIIPYQHGDSLNNLTRETRMEIMDAVTMSLNILEETFKNTGSNVGLNIGGKVAGGSIPDHLHIHVLPRYEGDTSFFTALSHTKAVSANLHAIYSKLKKQFDATAL